MNDKKKCHTVCILQSTSNKSSQMKFEIDDLEFKSLYVQWNLDFKKDLNLQINLADRFSV